jgi:mono/diheme cytochrome c family protein
MGDGQHNSHLSRANQLPVWHFLMAILGAMLLLLAGCQSEENAAPSAKLTHQQERGRQLFSANCQVCHETKGSASVQGPSLQGLYRKPSLPSGAPINDDRVRDAILLGRPNMPGYQNLFTDEQVNQVIAYLRTL